MRIKVLKTSYIFLCLCCLSLSACKEKKDQFDEAVITTQAGSVDGFEFSNMLVRKFNEQDIRYPKPKVISILKEQIIEDYIIQSTYENYASKNNIFVKKKLLDSAFEKLKASYPDLQSFEVYVNEAGLKISDVKDSIKKRLTRKLVRDKVLEDFKPEIKDVDLKNYYKENKANFSRGKEIKLKQIVVEHEEEALKIQDLIEQLKKHDFEDLAKKYSLTPEKIDGGELGWVEVNSFSAFKKAESIPSGQISPIIKSPNGYHIFKVEGHRSAKTQSFKAVKNEIFKSLKAKKEARYMETWLKEESAKLNAKINNDLISKIVVNRPSSSY